MKLHEWRSHPITNRVIGDIMSLSSKTMKQARAPMATYAQVMTQWHDGTFGSMGKSREGIPNTQITVMKRIPDA